MSATAPQVEPATSAATSATLRPSDMLMREAPPKMVKIAALLASCALCLIAAAPARAQQEKVIAAGKAEFQDHCTSCHGDDAKGDGRMAALLTVKPADLTQIAKISGGTFPFWQVYGVIEGAVPVKGHSYMPAWKSRFEADEGKPGTDDAYLRILTLTHYLESIQEK